MPNFQVLIVATQAFPSAARLSLRLKRYGADVKAVCPANSKLAHVHSISASYPLQGQDPLASVRAAIDESRPDFIIPIDDRAVWFLHELSQSHPQYKSLVERSIGSAASYPIMRSRVKMMALAVELGIAVPTTRRIHNRSDLDRYIEEVNGPFFLKKDGTWAASGVRCVSDLEQAGPTYQRLLRYPTFPVRLKQRLDVSDPTAFTKLKCLDTAEISAQALIEGVPATAMFACHEGEILGNVQARVISSRGKLGVSIMIQLIEDERMARAGALIAAKLGITGFFGLDFIIENETKIPYLIELNPRCTQFGHIAMANKPDLAGLLFTRLTGSNVPRPGSSELGSYISFFPTALEYDPTSPFLKQSRSDVCAEDLETIVALNQVKPSFKSWLRSNILKHVAALRVGLRPTPATTIYYFETFGKQEPLAPNTGPLDARSLRTSR